MLSVLHTLYSYIKIFFFYKSLSLVVHAGMNVASIAEKINPWVMSFFLAMIALFKDGMKHQRKLYSVYIFISLGISLNYLY